MMKCFWILGLSTFCSAKGPVSNIELAYLRKNYERAVADKNLCELMIEDLEKNTISNVHLAYLGALQNISATHTLNPFTKLKIFRKGKANIEKAVENESDNAEIRFIRLSVQMNCPGFLGYKEKIKEDKLFLTNNLESIRPEDLRKMVESILKN